jgi:hypothetical protein
MNGKTTILKVKIIALHNLTHVTGFFRERGKNEDIRFSRRRV